MGQRQRAIDAVEQRLAKLVFERANRPADRRLRDELLACRAREAQVTRGGTERA
jgi:hypothetical protein